jgi:hypothetical protein
LTLNEIEDSARFFLFTRVKVAGRQVSHVPQEAMVGFDIDDRRFVLDEYNSRGKRMA